MQQLQQWFDQLKRSEQMLLASCALVLVLYLVYQLLIAPLAWQQQQLQRSNEQARQTLVRVRELAAQYRQQSASGQGTDTSRQRSLSQIVDETVVRHQLAMKRFQPSSNGDASVRFENTAFTQFLAWLYEIETAHPVVVKDLSVSPASGSGLVNISVRLRPGA